MNTAQIVKYLRAQNDLLEAELDAKQEALEEAARRMALLERKERLERQARELGRHVRQAEGTPRKKGYWETLRFKE